MLKINLAQIAKDLSKNISQIAKETGINRNTITALFHNKVDGVKFSTLEKLIKKYDLKVADLIVEENNKKEEVIVKNDIYRQEAEAVLFTGWAPLIATGNMNKNHFDNSAPVISYWENISAFFYWPKDKARQVAEDVYHKFGAITKTQQFIKILENNSKDLKNLYLQTDLEKIEKMSVSKVLGFFNKLEAIMTKMWQTGIFIDCFDEGYDQEVVTKITKKYNFTKEELGILTTPIQLTFIAEKDLAFLRHVKKVGDKNLSQEKLKQYIQTNIEVRKTIHEFDYYKTTYGLEKHISDQEVLDFFQENIKNKVEFENKLNILENYPKTQQVKIDNVLIKYKLKENPLHFFQAMTFWREYRKQLNLMDVQILFAVLNCLEILTGIPRKYLEFLTFDEVELVLKGSISVETLKRRREQGILIEVKENDYKIYEAEEAASLRAGYEKRAFGEIQDNIIYGQVASQGYAKGIARIVLNQEDFHKFKPGEILITGMTRPEFVPLMKQAEGIVTNEGGITCHAAIVSRELGKPCIIGTKNATLIVKDGDLIEVRANHGTVRILERN